MSIISLKSLDGQNAYDFANHFREGIELKKGATIQLVNMTINKDQSIIVDGGNNIFLWRIGNAQSYNNHHIFIRQGSYTGDSLAQEITHELNLSTIIGQYENTWKVNYDSSVNNNKGGFIIDYAQNTPPAETGQNYEEVSWSRPGGANQLVEAQGPNYSVLAFVNNGLTDNITNISALWRAPRGIFSNGGANKLVVNPSVAADDYGKVICGWSRYSMAYPEKFGYDPVAQPQVAIGLTAAGAGVSTLDGYVSIESDGLGSSNLIVRTLTNTGIAYPNVGWFNMNQRFNQDLATFLPSLNYGQDNIELNVYITGNLNQQYTIAHDNAGDGVFANETIIIQSGAGTFATTIKESYYPLIGISGGSAGVVDKSRYLSSGIYDKYLHDPTTDLSVSGLVHYKSNLVVNDDIAKGLRVLDEIELQNGIHNYNESNKESGKKHNTQLGAPLTLMYISWFDLANAADYVAGGGPIPNVNRPLGPDDISSAGELLGLDRVYYYATPAAGQTLTSSNDINYDIEEPSLIVELPDFNIKSYNGSTGDIVKAISLVPREELATNDNYGTLHYAQEFALPISLNLETDQIIYQIRVRLRDSEGKVETTLKAPTQLILYLNNDSGNNMDNLVNKLKSVMGNKQGLEISENPINKYL